MFDCEPRMRPTGRPSAATAARMPAVAAGAPSTQRRVSPVTEPDDALGQALRRAVLQRHRTKGPGIPGTEVVRQGALLWHGTPVQAFADRREGARPGAKIPTPSAPAWLAGDPAFSAHVSAALHPAAQMWLHPYTVHQDLRLLAFDSCADLALYLGVVGPLVNDAIAAAAVLAKHGPVDGYMLEADSVREQPEYILFAPGLAKLRRSEDPLMLTESESRWDQGPGDERSRKHILGDQHFGMLSGGMTYSM